MSYIPDYRCEENEKHLNEVDRAFLLGFRAAIELGLDFFDNGDIYECTEEEEKVLAEAKDCFADWMNTEDIECTCSVFENADYISDDVDIKDMNPPMYINLRGAETE